MLDTTHIVHIKRLLLLMIGLMLVIMAFYIWKYNQEETIEVTKISLEHLGDDADLVATDIVLTEMSGDRILWTLEAKEAKVYNKAERDEIWGKDITVDFYDEHGEKNMHLVSDQGTKENKTGNIVASGHVRATSFVEEITLKTSKLVFDATLNKIISDQHVIIERGNVITSGDGLESNLSLTEAKILRNVVTSFTPDDFESE